MKKTFLMVMLCITTTVTICQSYYKIHSNTLGVWNTHSNQYEWQDKKYVDMDLTMKGSLIMISDNAKSYYITGKQIDNTDKYNYQQYAWYAKDEKNRNCIIKLYYPKYQGELTGATELYVMYTDYAYVYDVSND